MSVCPFVYVSVYVSLSVCLRVCVCLSVRLSTCLSVLSTCLSFLSMCLSASQYNMTRSAKDIADEWICIGVCCCGVKLSCQAACYTYLDRSFVL